MVAAILVLVLVFSFGCKGGRSARFQCYFVLYSEVFSEVYVFRFLRLHKDVSLCMYVGWAQLQERPTQQFSLLVFLVCSNRIVYDTR